MEFEVRKEDLDEIQINNLISIAQKARTMAYAPYSNYTVGAALLAKNGSVFTGCNIENVAYSPTNCAERTAFFKAVSEGVREFDAIAVVGGPRDVEIPTAATPCGVCRQVMMEFCDPEEFLVVLSDEVMTLKEILPLGFGPSNLEIRD